MNIHVVFAIVVCNMSAFRASRVLLSLFAIELGAAQVTIGALIAMYSVFPVLLGLYAGQVSDKLGVGRPMAYGSIGISCAMLVPYLWPSVAALYVSAALIGASHVFYNVSVQNLVGYLSTPEDRTRNFSNYGLVMATDDADLALQRTEWPLSDAGPRTVPGIIRHCVARVCR